MHNYYEEINQGNSMVSFNYPGSYAQTTMQFQNGNPFKNKGWQNFENINFNYWCETCDKGFKTTAHLEIHKQQHQKCNIDGCQFIAHPKVITKHIQMQHSTGLYKKIAHLNNPEDIKKWRDERKRKYPTKENIEKKAAEIKEKIARGEKMGINGNRMKKNYQDKIGSDNGHHSKNKFNSKHEKYFNGRKRFLPREKIDNATMNKKVYKPVIIQEEPRELKPFFGIQNLIVYEDDTKDIIEDSTKDLIEDDEYVQDIPNGGETPTESSKNLLCSALTALICDYGSSDEDNLINDKKHKSSDIGNNISNKKTNVLVDDKLRSSEYNNKYSHEKKKDESMDRKCTNVDSNANKNLKTNEVDYKSDNDSGPEEQKIITIESQEISKENTNLKTHKQEIPKFKRDKNNSRNMPLRRKLPSTLLEKLLHREIQQERNIVLQCIRFIVQNNYFGENK